MPYLPSIVIAPVRCLQQQGSAIGTGLTLIELQHGRLVKNTGEQQTLCRAIVRHAKASLALKTLFLQGTETFTSSKFQISLARIRPR